MSDPIGQKNPSAAPPPSGTSDVNDPAAPPASKRSVVPPSRGDGMDAPAEAKADGTEAPAADVDPLAAATAEAARLKDMWMRTAADFDNFRKRARREVEDAKKSGKEDFLREVLPVFDNLERAVQSAQRATDVSAVSQGLSMVLKQLEGTLVKVGIAKVATIGSAFDPSVHEAIQQLETDEHAPGTVIAEIQPGYVQGDRLIRAAMVVVAKAKAAPAPDAV
ncbi:MAG: nucleotide exchange factor GrpE [Polyangiaceae bacterium]